MGIPKGIPKEIPMRIPMGIPMRIPMGIRKGLPMGIPLGIQMGIPILGSKIISSESNIRILRSQILIFAFINQIEIKTITSKSNRNRNPVDGIGIESIESKSVLLRRTGREPNRTNRELGRTGPG